MRLLYLGRLNTLYAYSIIFVFSKNGYEVSALNTRISPRIFPKEIEGIEDSSYIYNLYEDTPLPYDIGRIFLTNFCGHNKTEKIGKFLQMRKIEIILSYWGSVVFPEIKMIKKKFSIPIIHNFETYPVYRSYPLVKLENMYCRKGIERLEGRIHSTPAMLEYMKRNFDLSYGRDLVFMEWLSNRFLPRKRLKKLSAEDGAPHIVFIGNPSLTGMNDVRSQIKRITAKNIHVHLCKTNNQIDAKLGFAHMFREFSPLEVMEGSLTTFMTQFDASLVLYNVNKNWCLDRYRNSTSSRFLFSLIAGIPIIMPYGLFKGCQQIVNEHQIGFAYTSYEDLKMKLNDKELMARLQENAASKSHDFTFENNFQRIDKFIRSCELEQCT